MGVARHVVRLTEEERAELRRIINKHIGIQKKILSKRWL